MLLEDLKPGLYSKYKPFLKRDSGFFKRLKRVRVVYQCMLYDRYMRFSLDCYQVVDVGPYL